MQNAKKKTLRNTLLALIIMPCVVLAASLLAGTPETPKASAASGGATIDLTDTTTLSGTGWTYTGDTDGIYDIEGGANVTIIGAGGLVTRSIRADGAATITLQNASIGATASLAPISTKSTATSLTINLVGNNMLFASGTLAGINIMGGATLTITTAAPNDYTSKLAVSQTGTAPAIRNTSGTVNINGGNIAVGTQAGANGIDATKVSINNALVNASGASGYGIQCSAYTNFSMKNNAVLVAAAMPSYYFGSDKYYTSEYLYVTQASNTHQWGNVTLNYDLTIPSGYSISITTGCDLTVNTGVTLTNNGNISLFGSANIYNRGTIAGAGTINKLGTGDVIDVDAITFTAAQYGGIDGRRDTVSIQIVFSEEVSNSQFETSYVTVTNGTGTAAKSSYAARHVDTATGNETGYTGTSTTWRITLTSVTTAGNVTVGVADFGAFSVTTAPQTVAVYKDTRTRFSVSILPNGAKNSTDTTEIKITLTSSPAATLKTGDLLLTDIVDKTSGLSIAEQEKGEISMTGISFTSPNIFNLAITVVKAGQISLQIGSWEQVGFLSSEGLNTFGDTGAGGLRDYVVFAASVIQNTAVHQAKQPATVTAAAPASIIYGETLGDPSATATAAGTFTYYYTGTTSNGAGYSSASKPAQPGSYTVTATLVSETHIGEGGAGFTISKKTLTWGASGIVDTKPYDGTKAATVITQPALNGVVNGDNVTVNATAEFVSANANNSASVILLSHTVAGADLWKYNQPAADPTFANAVISKAPKSVTQPVYAGGALTYGDGLPTIATVTAGGSIALNAGQTLSAGTRNYNWTFIPDDTNNYQWSNTTGTISLTVDKAQINKPALNNTTFTYEGKEKTVDLNVSDAAYALGGDTKRTDAGSYTATVSLTDAANCEWKDGTTAPLSLMWTITQASGQAVPAPTLNYASGNSISVYAAPALAGQTVEYAINTTDAAPATGWQDDTLFTGLSNGTKYYIFARSKENKNYKAGLPSAALEATAEDVPSENNPAGPNDPNNQNEPNNQGDPNNPADPKKQDDTAGKKKCGCKGKSGAILLTLISACVAVVRKKRI